MLLRVFVAPQASRTRVIGPYGDALKVAVAAPPDRGAANRALVEFLSQQLHCRAVEVVAGPASRRKRVRIRGVEAHEVEARLSPRDGPSR